MENIESYGMCIEKLAYVYIHVVPTILCGSTSMGGWGLTIEHSTACIRLNLLFYSLLKTYNTKGEDNHVERA